jgi:hypothetical protein
MPPKKFYAWDVLIPARCSTFLATVHSGLSINLCKLLAVPHHIDPVYENKMCLRNVGFYSKITRLIVREFFIEFLRVKPSGVHIAMSAVLPLRTLYIWKCSADFDYIWR